MASLCAPKSMSISSQSTHVAMQVPAKLNCSNGTCRTVSMLQVKRSTPPSKPVCHVSQFRQTIVSTCLTRFESDPIHQSKFTMVLLVCPARPNSTSSEHAPPFGRTSILVIPRNYNQVPSGKLAFKVAWSFFRVDSSPTLQPFINMPHIYGSEHLQRSNATTLVIYLASISRYIQGASDVHDERETTGNLSPNRFGESGC
jgi:hypothetical protein